MRPIKHVFLKVKPYRRWSLAVFVGTWKCEFPAAGFHDVAGFGAGVQESGDGGGAEEVVVVLWLPIAGHYRGGGVPVRCCGVAEENETWAG